MNFQQLEFTIMLPRKSIKQLILLVKESPNRIINIPDVLINNPSHKTQSSKQKSILYCESPLFIADLGMKNSQFCQWFWSIFHYLVSYWSQRLGTKFFWNISFSPKISPNHKISANRCPKNVVMLLQSEITVGP